MEKGAQKQEIQDKVSEYNLQRQQSKQEELTEVEKCSNSKEWLPWKI